MRILAQLVVSFVIVLQPGSGFAMCLSPQCPAKDEPLNVQYAYNSADVVFVGTLVSYGGTSSGSPADVYQVKEIFKGTIEGNTVNIVELNPDAGCGTGQITLKDPQYRWNEKYMAGKDYLVYANGRDNYYAIEGGPCRSCVWAFGGDPIPHRGMEILQGNYFTYLETPARTLVELPQAEADLKAIKEIKNDPNWSFNSNKWENREPIRDGTCQRGLEEYGEHGPSSNSLKEE